MMAALIPLLIVPVVLPSVVLMAHRKRLTDSPNARKLQEQPVVVMGGTVILIAMCVTFVIANLFYPINQYYPGLCVMTILYIIGMLDDSIGMRWYVKLVVQALAILLLFFGGNNSIPSLYGLFFDGTLPGWLSCMLTVFVGLLLLNAVNFVDGIDGLASALAVFSASLMAYWSIRHGFVSHAIVSFVIIGAMTAFFFFNVFSKKYKMYLGDSGTMLIGLFVFITACPDPNNTIGSDFLVDRYFVSFMVALFSGMVFDLVRVVLKRLHDHKSPFLPDRTHLHHLYVDMGMCHLLATMVIVFSNGMLVLVWYITAAAGMNVELQFFVVLAAGVVFFWLPYFVYDSMRLSKPERFARRVALCNRLSDALTPLCNFFARAIDNR